LEIETYWKFDEMPDPEPRKKELLIEVKRSSVNYVDIRERQGPQSLGDGGSISLPYSSGLQLLEEV
jgi:NADPH2:quinone reductase